MNASGDATASLERAARLSLAATVEPGDARVGALVAEHGALGALDRLRRLPAEQRRYQGFADSEQVLADAAAVGARIVVPGDVEWPTQLDDLDDTAPLALWVIGAGDLRLLALRSLAVVGARASTPYGEAVARMWCSDLAERGWTVVSGGAYGIDSVAHRAALDADGVTLAVLASGVDVPYPRAHAALIARIAEDGLVVSESPPGTTAQRRRFLTRNRVIAALTRATLVVEAAWRSGTMSTALSAMRIGRTVLAVPGSVHAAASAGCHRLIREHGALLASQVSDVEAALHLPDEQQGALVFDDAAVDPVGAARPLDQLPGTHALVLDALPARGERTVEEIIASTGIMPPQLLGVLGALESSGWLRRTDRGYALARNPARGMRS